MIRKRRPRWFGTWRSTCGSAGRSKGSPKPNLSRKRGCPWLRASVSSKKGSFVSVVGGRRYSAAVRIRLRRCALAARLPLHRRGHSPIRCAQTGGQMRLDGSIFEASKLDALIGGGKLSTRFAKTTTIMPRISRPSFGEPKGEACRQPMTSQPTPARTANTPSRSTARIAP